MKNDSSTTSRGSATSISGSSQSRGGKGLARPAPDQRAVPRKRSSKLTLEGVEYDLSNLFGVKGSNPNSSSSSSHLHHPDDNEDDDVPSCRGTVRRDQSNASSVYSHYDQFDSTDPSNSEPTESPYRFDLNAMRTLMTSFRGIPELQNSFRLSKTGQVLAVDDTMVGVLLGGKQDDESEEDVDERELLPAPRSVVSKSTETNNKPNNLSLQRNSSAGSVSRKDSQHRTVTGKIQARPKQDEPEPPVLAKPHPIETRDITNTTETTVPYEQDDDNSMSDLVYDEATGTYIYHDPLAQSEYHEVLTSEEFLVDSDDGDDDKSQPKEEKPPSHRYSLEDMTANVALAASSPQQQDITTTTTTTTTDTGGRQPDILDDYDDEEHEMEISPGVYVPFRGAKETWHAVATQTTHELVCFDCSTDLVCINDCEYTVCPDCRVVNPVFSDHPVGKPFGVGMGFRKEWVVQKQKQLQLKCDHEDSDAAVREETRKEMTLARRSSKLKQPEEAHQPPQEEQKIVPQKSTPQVEEPSNFATGTGGHVGTGGRRSSGARRGLRRGPS